MAECGDSLVNENVVQEISNKSERKTEQCKEKRKSDDCDPELEQLLESALEGFEDASQGENNQKASEESFGEKSFDEDLAEQTAKQFEEMMRVLMNEDPAVMQQLKEVASNSEETNKEFAQNLAQTLNGLSQNAENLQSPFTEEELLQAINGITLDEGTCSDGEMDFLPMMNGMMRTLLSKDVLYPSLKDLVDKYPHWLAENRESVDKNLYEKYSCQFDLMDQMVKEFDKEKAEDSEDTKKERFEIILDRMQKMQELGHPPQQLVGQMAPGLEFDEQGRPKFPNFGDDMCGVM